MATSTKRRQNAAQKLMLDGGASKVSRRGRSKAGRVTQRIYQSRSPNKHSVSERRRAARLRARRGRAKAIAMGKLNVRGDGRKHASNKWRNRAGNLAFNIYGSDRYSGLRLPVLRAGYTGPRRYAELRTSVACACQSCAPWRVEMVPDPLGHLNPVEHAMLVAGELMADDPSVAWPLAADGGPVSLGRLTMTVSMLVLTSELLRQTDILV